MTLGLSWAAGGKAVELVGCGAGELARARTLVPDQLAAAFPVFPAELIGADGDGAPPVLQPMAGRYDVVGDAVRFTPRFPFLAGTVYAMVVTGQGETLRIEREATTAVAETSVTMVHPEVTALPRNALRLYVHFSAPMAEGHAAANIHLERTDTGAPLVGAFSPLDPELWDTEHRRLTVLLDPARIKRGLAPHRQAGYPLEEGAPVTLVVERGLRDARGLPLRVAYRRTYEVGPDLRGRVDPAAWQVEAPAAGSMDALVVRFERPLDHALAERCLAVLDSDGRVVTGVVTLTEDERRWELVPQRLWVAGDHELVVDPRLEDVAGNSVCRVFDRDLQRAEDDPVDPTARSVAFSVAAAAAAVAAAAAAPAPTSLST